MIKHTKAILIFTQAPCKEAARKRLYRGASSKSAHKLVEANFQHVLNVSHSIPNADTFVFDSDQLAQTMITAGQKAFFMGYKEVLFLGSDLPTLTPEILKTAFDKLKQSSAVVGPCADGGFFLFGVTSRVKNQLKNILEPLPLFTKQACAALVQKLTQLHYTPALLGFLNDIDSWKDLLHVKGQTLWSTLSRHIRAFILSRFFMPQNGQQKESFVSQMRAQMAFCCFSPAPPVLV